jgi:hypothetical protein
MSTKFIKTFENFSTDEMFDVKVRDMKPEDLASEEPVENYMFMGDLQTIKRLVDAMLQMDPMQVDDLLKNGHNWAVDHVVSSKDDIEEVFNFLRNELDEPSEKTEGETE